MPASGARFLPKPRPAALFEPISAEAQAQGAVAMAYDFKKEFRELCRPSGKPGILIVPPMSYVAARGKGDSNA